MIVIKKFVPLRLESLNKTNNRKFGYKNYHDRIFRDGALFLQVQKKKPDVIRRVTVKYCHTSKRLFDDENLSGAFKPVFDLLVRLKYLHDDSAKWCVRVYEQERVSNKDVVGCWIIVEDVE